MTLRCLCALVWLLLAAPARADAPSRVVLLEPTAAPPSTMLREALVRARAELEAGGFTVVAAPATAAAEPRALANLAREQGAVAAIAVSLDEATLRADIWVVDRVTDKALMRSVDVRDVPAPRRASVLAIRALELLRASLLERLQPPPDGGHPRPPAPPDVQRWIAPEPATEPGARQGIHLELGVGALVSVDGLGAAVSPGARLGYGGRLGLGGRLSWWGPAFGARADGPRGGATVRQELLLLESVYTWSGPGPLALGASLGAGFFHLAAEGDPLPPLRGRHDDVWSLGFAGGVGAGYRLSRRLTLWGDGQVLLAAPRPVVTAGGQPLGSAGRPSLLFTLDVIARL